MILLKTCAFFQDKYWIEKENVVDQDSYVLSTHLVTKGLFVRNVTITVPVRSLKCVNGDGHFDRQNVSGTHSLH